MTDGTQKELPRSFWEMTSSFGLIWWLFHTLCLAVGILLLLSSIDFPEWLMRPFGMIPHSKFHLLLGIFLVTIPLSHIVNHALAYNLSVVFKLNPWASRENIYPPALIGVFESVMYPILLISNKPEFVGAWLALKVAGGWKGWQHNAESRRRFFKFLIGNLVTIILASITYLAILSFVIL
jgi:hypothetical protein